MKNNREIPFSNHSCPKQNMKMGFSTIFIASSAFGQHRGYKFEKCPFFV
jgi:hypothetical protein